MLAEQLQLGGRDQRIVDDFFAFHEKNPWVYAELVKLARRARSRGARKVGIGMLAEIVRWRRFMATQDFNSGFKLNNNYRAGYVRLIESREPDLAGVFETRASVFDEVFS